MRVNHLEALLIAIQWLAMVAITGAGFEVLGWTKLKQYPIAIGLWIAILIASPCAGLLYVAHAHARGLVAFISPRKSDPIILPRDCSFFPEDNVWNTSVRDLPVEPRSAQYIDSMGPGISLHADFGVVAGYEYSMAGRDERVADITFQDASGESDPGPYRIPDDAPVEEGSDHHVLVVDPTRCQLYELFGATRIGPHVWEAGSGAIFDLRSNSLRPAGWTSADAAGLPIVVGLVRYDEVRAGSIRHALRFTTPYTRNAFVWPARHRASASANRDLPPMGQRFRLRESFDVTGFSLEAQVILNALKDYGMILADNGGPWFISGVRDSRWRSHVTSELQAIHGSDFEAIDSGPMIVMPESGQARQYMSVGRQSLRSN